MIPIGLLLVCLTSWSLKVIAFYCKHFATFSIDQRTEITPIVTRHVTQNTIDDDNVIKKKMIFD